MANDKSSGAQFMMNGDATLRVKGGDGTALYVHAGTVVGADTPYDFEGPPNAVMAPLNDAARAAIELAKREHPPGADVDYAETPASPLKNTPAPSEGGAKPADPASPEVGPNDPKPADDPKTAKPGDGKSK